MRDEEQPQLYRKYQEEHFQRAYTLEQIRHMLTEAGLEYVTAYDDYTKESPHDRSERICVVASLQECIIIQARLRLRHLEGH